MEISTQAPLTRVRRCRSARALCRPKAMTGRFVPTLKATPTAAFSVSDFRFVVDPGRLVRPARSRAYEAEILTDVNGLPVKSTGSARSTALGCLRPRLAERNRAGAKYGGPAESERPEYPARALREVLANAVAHADYSQRTMPLRVQIYDDRLEVENPGGWPLGFDEEDFKNGVSKIRNPVIARVLHEPDLSSFGSHRQRHSISSA